MTRQCDLCKREMDKGVIWINGMVGLPDLDLCQECDLSFGEQWYELCYLFKEVK